jgi:hypothetical protein
MNMIAANGSAASDATERAITDVSTARRQRTVSDGFEEKVAIASREWRGDLML